MLIVRKQDELRVLKNKLDSRVRKIFGSDSKMLWA